MWVGKQLAVVIMGSRPVVSPDEGPSEGPLVHHRRYRQHRHRRHHRRRGFMRQRWALCLALFAASAGASFLVALHPPAQVLRRWLPQPRSTVENPADDLFDARSSFAVDPAVAGGRLIYPYSVIPGGAHSPQELKQEIARDPVVAAHYADFDVARARVVVNESERLLYASYRLRNQIFWTRRRLIIPKGETLLTDGIHFARTRCGNQLSAEPQERISAFEPPPKALETPVPVAPAAPGLEPGSPPLIASLANLEGPAPPPPAFAGPAAPPPAGGLFVIPPGPGSPTTFHGPPPPLPPGGIIIPTPPGVPPMRKHQKKPPPPPVPEPGTVLLVSSGLGYLFYRRKRSEK